MFIKRAVQLWGREAHKRPASMHWDTRHSSGETHITLMAHPEFVAVGHDQTMEEWTNLQTTELASVRNRFSDSELILQIQLVRSIPRRDNVYLQESIRKFSKMKKPGWKTTPLNHPASRRYRRYGICNLPEEHWHLVY